MCGSGTQVRTDQIGCNNCAIGKYKGTTSVDLCAQAQVGHYSNDRTQQIPCGSGSYQDQAGQNSCKQCSGEDSFQDGAGKTDCKTCQGGKFANSDPGGTQCDYDFVFGDTSGWHAEMSTSPVQAELFTSPTRAIDGNFAVDWASGSCIMTDSQPNAWWGVDFEEERTITQVTVWGMAKALDTSLDKWRLYVGNGEWADWGNAHLCGEAPAWNGQPTTITCGQPAFGEVVTGQKIWVVTRDDGDDVVNRQLKLCEVEIKGWQHLRPGGKGDGHRL